MLIAHTSHWLVNLAYIAPVAGFLVWLGFATLKQRRAAAAEEKGRPGATEPPSG